MTEHLSKVRDAQEKGIRMQRHYLSNDIVNEFINQHLLTKNIKKIISQNLLPYITEYKSRNFGQF